MRICYIGWADHIHLIRWAQNFIKLGHKILILTPSQGLNKSLNAFTIKIFTRNMRKSLSNIEYLIWSNLFMSNIIHAHWAGFGDTALTSSLGIIPYGITVWGSDIYRLNEFPYESQYRITFGLKNADFVTCDSHDLKKKLISLGITQDKIYIIQWGVDTSIFRPNVNTELLKKELNIPEKANIIFSPRQIAPIYNIETIIKAFAELLKKESNIILIQKYYKTTTERLIQLKEYAKNLGIGNKIRWIGTIPYRNMPLLYSIADIVVSIPFSDSTPMSILEAMACGKPIIASNLPSIKEWIVHGKNGLLVDPMDINTLIFHMLFLLKNKETRALWGKINRLIVLKKASQDVHMRHMEKIYKKLVKTISWKQKMKRFMKYTSKIRKLYAIDFEGGNN